MRNLMRQALCLLCALAGLAALAVVDPKDAPAFSLTARVVTVAGQQPDGKKFTFDLSGIRADVEGGAWSAPLAYGEAQVEAANKGYPNIYMGYPLVARLSVSGVVDPTVVEGKIVFNEHQQEYAFTAELFGPTVGLLIWRDADKKPRAATMADYNRQRYWEVMKSVKIPDAHRPKHFPIVDRFINGDNDRRNLEEGLGTLSRAGFNALFLPPDKFSRDVLLKVTGLSRTSWAVYNPPGYAFDFTPQKPGETTPEGITQWAQSLAKPYIDAGYKKDDIAIYAMSDEPGWYFPGAFEPLMKDATAMARFHQYLAAQGLKPKDVGAKSWETVLPIGRSKAVDLPSRKLFYWTMRFFAWDSSRHFAVSTKALENELYPNVPIITNWNFFSGRLYVPGPVANNGAKQDPDAAMGGHDWLEFGRMRGGTMLWTEDWFGDQQAYQWSFYCAKMRSAAALGDITFGSYVIPRTAGQRENGIVQKILTIIGMGGKGLKYFVFGPEYTFPGNCYSENVKVLPKMAEAHAMIGRAEDVLWPGKSPQTPVAILHPRSAQLWDAKEVKIPTMISDATNTNLNAATVDYMAEVFDLYLALQHANIPTDFVDEDDLSAKGLSRYKVLFVTEPNIPVEGQQGLIDWVKKGGALVLVSNAGTADRYDDPTNILAKGLGIAEQPRQRMLIANPRVLQEAGTGSGAAFGDFTAFGPRGAFATPPNKGVLATFSDGAPALVERQVGRGRVYHFPWMPGLSYFKSQNGTKDKLPVGFSAAIRAMISYPVRQANVVPPVLTDRAMIETPMLLSDKGAAVTLLNWTGEQQPAVKLTITVPFAVKSLESLQQGHITCTQQKNQLTCTLPVGDADILVLKP